MTHAEALERAVSTVEGMTYNARGYQDNSVKLTDKVGAVLLLAAFLVSGEAK